MGLYTREYDTVAAHPVHCPCLAKIDFTSDFNPVIRSATRQWRTYFEVALPVDIIAGRWQSANDSEGVGGERERHLSPIVAKGGVWLRATDGEEE